MKLLHRSGLAAAAAALSLLLGCDSPTTPKKPVPARLEIVSGDLQTQTVAKELAQPLVVRVTDDKGKAVKGQVVNFRVVAGGGSVFAGTALTDANGEARERWTLGTVARDTQRVEARAVDPATGQALVFATFRAVGTADVPSSVGPAGATAFTGVPLLPLTDSVAAVVRDVYGNPVPATTVVWTVKQGGGSVSPATTATDADGVARTSWTLGAPLDSLQVIEAAASLTLKTQFTANGRVPLDAVVVKVSGDAQTDTAGHVLPQPLVVRVQRANGTPLAGIPVTFTLPPGSGSVNPASAVTNAAGQVSVQWTLGTGTGAMSATAAISNGSSVTFGATSVPHATPVHMTFIAPRPNQVVGDSVLVSVRIDSANALVSSMVASAGGNSVNLGLGNFVSKKLSLVGTPFGPLELRVTATTVNGDTSIITETIIHDAPPAITFSSPREGYVARPSLRLDADCTDDGPSGCVSIKAQLRDFDSGPFAGAELASGTTGIHTTVSLAAFEEHRFQLEYTATDSRGQTTTVRIFTMFVESSAALTAIDSAGTRAFDVDSTRLLFADSAQSLFVRSGGSNALVAPRARAKQAFLHPYGAAFNNDTAFDWRPGSLTRLGFVNSVFKVSGPWLIWTEGPSLYRRDLAAETNVLVASDANNVNDDVAPNGAVAYGSGVTKDIYLYAGGTTTPITADADNAHWNVGPVTDGVSVVYIKTNQTQTTGLAPFGYITLWRAGVETVLSDSVSSYLAPQGGYYAANNGWIAYVTHDASGVLQIHTRGPDDTDRLVAATAPNGRLVALSRDGAVAYATGGSLYVTRAPYTGAPVRVARDWTSDMIVKFRGPDLLFLLGNTAFRASY